MNTRSTRPCPICGESLAEKAWLCPRCSYRVERSRPGPRRWVMAVWLVCALPIVILLAIALINIAFVE